MMLPVKIAVLFLLLTTVTAKPVVKKLNFNIFLLTPNNSSDELTTAERDAEAPVKDPVKLLLSTNGLSRFPPILEYVVQRIQGMFSVHVHADQSQAGSDPQSVSSPLLTNSDLQLLASTDANVSGVNQPPDMSENEVIENEDEEEEDRVGAIHGIDSQTGLPNVIVKPSSLHPGTYEVEISVAVDDGKLGNADA